MNHSDTIFALSSGQGQAGIAVVRITGPGASRALLALAGPLPPPRRAVLRALRDFREASGVLDRGLVLWFPTPQSATGEDLAELHVHGGTAILAALFDVLGSLPDTRLAEPGEFTHRAYRNGRMDLVEVEGLSDLLQATTELQRQQAIFHMEGGASSCFDSWSERLTIIRARWEAAIDFADEEGVVQQVYNSVRPLTEALIASLQEALRDADRGDIVRRGARVVLVGAPNVGKSSILNRLAGREAAIVSSSPGTTRDIIEVTLQLGGLPVLFSDTAGLRDTPRDDIELEGMQRTRRALECADIVLSIASPETAFIPNVGEGSALRVYNKVDLGFSPIWRSEADFVVSAHTGAEFELLLAEITRLVSAMVGGVTPVVVRERHRSAIVKSIRLLNDSLMHGELHPELAAESVRSACHEMSRIMGRVDVEDVLGQIFSDFCIGK